MNHQGIKQRGALLSIQASHSSLSPKTKSHPRSFIQKRIPLVRILFVCSLLFAESFLSFARYSKWIFDRFVFVVHQYPGRRLFHLLNVVRHVGIHISNHVKPEVPWQEVAVGKINDFAHITVQARGK